LDWIGLDWIGLDWIGFHVSCVALHRAVSIFLFPFTWPVDKFKEKGWLVLFQNFIAVGPVSILYAATMTIDMMVQHQNTDCSMSIVLVQSIDSGVLCIADDLGRFGIDVVGDSVHSSCDSQGKAVHQARDHCWTCTVVDCVCVYVIACSCMVGTRQQCCTLSRSRSLSIDRHSLDLSHLPHLSVPDLLAFVCLCETINTPTLPRTSA
jgi:hypothetical protein